MPRLSCWFVRAALVYLASGFTLGALMLANKGLGFYPQLWGWITIHMELLLVGWLVQLAMGVAFWILPRLSQGRGRGNEKLSWLAFILINLGIGLVAAEPIFGIQGSAWAGRVAELVSVVVFVLGMWQRVIPFGSYAKT